jgi:CHAD domain-containing protein
VTKPVSSLLAKLLKIRLNRFVRNLDGLERGDIEALHRVRVASRRIRELVPVLQLDAGRTRKLGRRLRKVTSRLGAMREFDVLLLLVDELHVSSTGASSRTAASSGAGSSATATLHRNA